MDTIYKYPISIADSQKIEAPQNADFLHVGLDPHGTPCIWAEVDTSKELEVITVLIVGTGNPMPEPAGLYIGTFITGSFVWHAFVKRS